MIREAPEVLKSFDKAILTWTDRETVVNNIGDNGLTTQDRRILGSCYDLYTHLIKHYARQEEYILFKNEYRGKRRLEKRVKNVIDQYDLGSIL